MKFHLQIQDIIQWVNNNKYFLLHALNDEKYHILS